MEMEDDSVPSVGNTEEVPHDTSNDFCDPLLEEGIHINNHHNIPVEPHSPNVKYLFCKYCPYKTRFVGNLTKHVRTHTGEKPFSCRHCGKRFASRSNLNYHEATHTGNKRFQCFISGCQFKTQLRDSLNSHMRKIHGVLMQQNSTNPCNFPGTAPMDQLHSPSVAGPPGLPILQPINSMSNLPPIQDILTSPPASAGISLHSSLPPSLTSPVDIKPSVAELAQYMIALHEGTTPNLTAKHESRPQPPTPFSTTGEYNAIIGKQPMNNNNNEDGFNTSPVTVETDTESNQDSPRVGAPPELMNVNKVAWGNEPMAIQSCVPSIMPRLSASIHTPLTTTVASSLKPPRPVSTDLVTVGMSEPAKSSALSTELLKIFQNLGLDTSAILELLAAQGRLHICRSCNIVFPEYSTFVLHRGCHGNEGPFQCHFCQRRFPEKFGFLTHFMQCPNK